MTYRPITGHKHDVLVYSHCTCGFWIVYTPDGWQHDAAPYFWGNDHEPQPEPAAAKLARIYEVGHCDHFPDDLPEPGDRCKYCGVDLTFVGPGMADWEPVEYWAEREGEK